jgi:DNA-directed RNA polymerase specialized sigma24 family protein
MAARFPTTQWSVVLAARGSDSAEVRDALESLCGAYWYPLYAYTRSRGHDPETARDLTQGFFAHFLERDVLQPVAPEKGRFRAFLLACLKNFLAHERERAQALKRGGGVPTLSMDAEDAEGRFGREPADRLTPEQVFERRWGLTVMQRAMERLAAASASRPAQFDRLKGYLTDAEPTVAYRQAAADLGLSEAAVKTAVHRLRKEYGRTLREELAATIADPADLDDELRHLLEVIRPWQEAPP